MISLHAKRSIQKSQIMRQKHDVEISVADLLEYLGVPASAQPEVLAENSATRVSHASRLSLYSHSGKIKISWVETQTTEVEG